MHRSRDTRDDRSRHRETYYHSRHHETRDRPRHRHSSQFRHTSCASSRRNSVPREHSYYTADSVPQAHSLLLLREQVVANSFGAGVIRIPLLTEVVEMSKIVVEMRWEEINLVKDAIQMMKDNNIKEDLINEMKKGVNILQWEMSDKNIKPNDIPKLGPDTTNFTDISTWLIYYFDLLHENMHRITDLNYAMTMLSRSERIKLAKHEKNATAILKKFEDCAESFNLKGSSKNAYEKVVDEIRKNCSVCEKEAAGF